LSKKNLAADQAVPQTKMAYITNVYPLLSETFIVSEVKSLIQAGFPVRVFSLFEPRTRENELDDAELKAQTIYWAPNMRLGKVLPAHWYFIWHAPRTYLRTLRYAVQHRNRQASLRSLVRWSLNGGRQRKQLSTADLQNLLLHFVVVMPFAALIRREGYTWMHAAFANTPSSFALLTSKLTGVPYSVSAHAMDIFITPEILAEKLNNARFVVTCNHYNKSFLEEYYPEVRQDNIHPIYHGTDLQRFSAADRNEKAAPPVLLAVGRLVRKKGLAVLLRAGLMLKQRGVAFQIWIVGEGPERPRLEMFCRIHHLHETVKFYGACMPEEIKSYYQKATLFVLPCVQDENGDRDGIPNVIAEAMAMRLPVISSYLSAIPELVNNRVTGRLLAPNDPDELAAVIQELLEDPALAKRMGAMGRKRVEELFDSRKTLRELIALFEEQIAPVEDARAAT